MAASALEGVRIVDAATLGAAPFAATLLGELGADVIKVEQPEGGDPLRQWGTMDDGVGLMWKSIARNKRSVTIDLRAERGRELLRDLVAGSDVFMTNFRPQRLTAWGLDYASIRAHAPEVVMLMITAFGAEGPYSERPGFGTLVEAMSGFAHATGEADGPPTLPPFMLADGVASLNGAYAVMSALYHRDVHRGGGQLIDLSLLEPLSRLLEQSVVDYAHTGQIASRIGNRWDISAPRNAYPTADGRWIAMSGSAPVMALRAFRAIGREDLLEDPEFTDAQRRLAHGDYIDKIIADWIRVRGLDEAMRTFEAHEVAAAPVYDAEQLFNDPHVREREIYVEVEDHELGCMSVQAPAARLSATPARIDHLGPPLGAHTDEVLTEVVGMNAGQLAQLREERVI